jgi:hypothetical protein
MKKAVLLFCVFLIATGAGFAADFTRGPDAVQPGNFLLSSGFAVGNVTAGGTSKALFGFSVVGDFALPVFGLTVGIETGFLYGKILDTGISGIPIITRIGYHPDLGVYGLDIYPLGKIGFAFSFVEDESAVGFGLGLGLGGRYFVTNIFGLFIELGFDSYFFNKYGVSWTGRKFVTTGVTFRFGTRGGRISSSGSSASSSSASGGSLALAPDSDFSVTLGADNKTAVITSYNGRGGRIIIPDTIQGMPVVQIAEGAFRENTRVTEVVISEGVTAIGANAFLGCSRLTRVTLPSTIRSIGSGAFNGCGELLEVSIPGGVRITWNGNTFAGSSKLMLATQARLKELGYTGSF